jgi:hypothetical protein
VWPAWAGPQPSPKLDLTGIHSDSSNAGPRAPGQTGLPGTASTHTEYKALLGGWTVHSEPWRTHVRAPLPLKSQPPPSVGATPSVWGEGHPLVPCRRSVGGPGNEATLPWQRQPLVACQQAAQRMNQLMILRGRGRPPPAHRPDTATRVCWLPQPCRAGLTGRRLSRRCLPGCPLGGGTPALEGPHCKHRASGPNLITLLMCVRPKVLQQNPSTCTCHQLWWVVRVFSPKCMLCGGVPPLLPGPASGMSA